MSRLELPAAGAGRDEIFTTLQAMKARDLDVRDGRLFAYVYEPGAEVDAVRKDAYRLFLTENGLDPTAFPSLLRLENDLIAISLSHLNAPEGAVGSFTSGGTESILMAVKAARDRARSTGAVARRGEGNIVMPVTAHAAFHKAASYFDLDVRLVEVSPETCRVTEQAMAEAIDDETVLIIASSPQYAQGVCDPIPAIGRLALERELPLHVDACVGGWLLPYWARLGADVTEFDFTVPGVTSISMDLHKYAFCAKGASVVLYKDASFRDHQVFACASWTGYTVVNQTAQSSKTGGPLASAWATLHLIGDEGYLTIARQLKAATARLVKGVQAIGDLELVAAPDMCMFSFRSEAVSVFHLIDEMKVRGWHIQAQLSTGDHPANVHVSLHPGNLGREEAFLADLALAYEAAKSLPTGMLVNAMGDLLSSLAETDRESAGLDFGGLMAMSGISADSLPERMASINELLDVLPVDANEGLIKQFFAELFVPSRAPSAGGERT